ncbi:MAG: phosphatidylserine decarboxylase [Pseudomonadota bacterium]
MFDTLGRLLVPIHRDGHKFLAIALGVTLIGFLFWSTLGWIAGAVTAFIAFFFRDPQRVTPMRDGLVVAAADGEIVSVEPADPPSELAMEGGRRVRVSVYLSPFDVHVNRAPVAGRIVRSVYVPGAFVNAATDKASEENERRGLVIEPQSGPEIAVVQIAGLIARRIVTFAGEGDTVGIGQRFGLIRFGSRVDVYLPPGQSALVAVGQRAIAGETVLADLKSEEPEREARKS